MSSYKILPSLLSFLLQILLAIIIDGILHFFNIGFIGRYLGPIGVGFIGLSFIYSLRKKRFFTWGSLKGYLKLHEASTWLGSLLILVHAGIHFNALIPWLATGAMLINIASGFTGRYLLGKSREELENRRELLSAEGQSENEIDIELMWESLSVKVMQKWRSVHQPITGLFAGLTAFHIFIIFLYGGL